jgi:serine/threonine protein kinase/class 3 adenylate cyclase
MTAPPASATADPDSGERRQASLDRPPSDHGLFHYRLLAQLAAGPEGVHYRAQESEAGRLVEIKVLDATLDPARRKELYRRLRTAALLNCPGAVAVVQVALDGNPPFLVQEWLEAPTLEAAEPPPRPVAEAILLGLELARTLMAAHRIGLIHGSLSPQSIRRTSHTTAKLDFAAVATGAPVSADWLAPEVARGQRADFAADDYGLGGVIGWLLTGEPPSRFVRQSPLAPGWLGLPAADAQLAPLLEQLLQEMLAADPGGRPWTSEIHQRLQELRQAACGSAFPEVAVADTALMAPAPRKQLGRFDLVEVLGRGGMGEVYRAVDAADGATVAVKTLRSDRAGNADLLRRFYKEARMLAEVNNPYVANLLEVNEADGLPYLVLEFVGGQSIAHYLTNSRTFTERSALAVVGDVARALAEAHQRGIVHRDIKPDNILFVTPPGTGPELPHVKLSDFGLARHVIQTESLEVTRAGAVVGTPLYLAPEQCRGEPVSSRTDIYAMGATLFHMLAGQPPFRGASPVDVMLLHCNEPVPALQKLNPAISDGTCQLVNKCLAKAPEARYPDAQALLGDIERLLSGAPTSIAIHPRLPGGDPANQLAYDFRWELKATPDRLWPHVSNTERLNRAVGLSAVQFTSQTDPGGGVRRFGKVRKAGLPLTWEEHPFEWVAPQRFGVLREFQGGPFKWFVSLVELTPRGDGGTTLVQRIRLEPRGLLGRTAAAVEIGIRAKRSLERVYRRIDAALTGPLAASGLVDPFEEPAQLSGRSRQRLDVLLHKLGVRGINPGVVERLGDYLAQAPPQEAGRIRPLALARRLALDPQETVAACLHGAREGLLVLLWDILCPVCRIPSENRASLRQLLAHGRCEACNLDFELDLAHSVEMIFRIHPEIRPSDLATYCIGGPAHSPHVVAQVRLAAGERIELDLALSEGAYRLRGPQLPGAFDWRVLPATAVGRLDITIPWGTLPETPPALRLGKQVITVTNQSAQELMVRLERTAPRDDALTAARASTMALFRELFADEVLSADQLVRVATVTFLVTELVDAGRIYAELGDAQAFQVVRTLLGRLHERVRREGGAVVKTVGEGILAVFEDTAAAVRVGRDLSALLVADEKMARLQLRAAIHRGPALAANLNDNLDYFGATVNEVMHLPALARAGDLLLTPAVAADPQVAALLTTQPEGVQLLEADLPGGKRLLRVLSL